MANRIAIVVSGGLIDAVYAADPALCVEVIDRDTDCPERVDDINDALQMLNEQVDEGDMHPIY